MMNPDLQPDPLDRAARSALVRLDPVAAPLAAARLAEDAERARAFVQQARAENTRRAYRADWRSFTAWCESRGLPSLPAAPETVALYVASQSELLKVSSLSRHLSAISQIHKAAGFASPARRTEEPLHSVWAGLVRSQSLARQKVAPALTEELRHTVAAIDREIEQVGREPASTAVEVRTKRRRLLAARRDRAILLLGFAAALRRSEIAAVQVPDLGFGADGLRLLIQRSKADQVGAGAVLGIRFGAQPVTCPVRAVQGWLRAAGVTSGPLFREIDRHGNLGQRSLDGATIARIVKKRVAEAGLDPILYSGHSLRAGFCTQAARAGVTERVIMRHSRHKDVKTLREYIRDGGLFLENPTDQLGL